MIVETLESLPQHLWYSRPDKRVQHTLYQGCKRELFFRDRDVWKFVWDWDETFPGFSRDRASRRDRDLSRPRPRCFSRCRKRYSLLKMTKAKVFTES